MYILGISAFYHDSAAALIRDGEVIAAAQEERFTRVKHDNSFPHHAAGFCLNEAAITIDEIDSIVFFEKPLLKFERLLESYLAISPRGFASFKEAMPLWLDQKLFQKRIIVEELLKLSGNKDKPAKAKIRSKLLFSDHHLSHAASAFFASPFEEAVVLTLDGVGEWATASVGVGRGNTLEIEKEILFPHSLGFLYSAFTSYLGFRVNSGEYKLMGLAPYGRPHYAKTITNHLVDIKEDGSFSLNQTYFDYIGGKTMISHAFHELFDGAPRKPDDKITQRHKDLAASIQFVTEEIVCRIVRALAREHHGIKNLCLAGGVALNCVANGRIVRENHFAHVWVQPAAGDSGCALGAALAGYYLHHKKARDDFFGQDSMKGGYLGPSFAEADIENTLKNAGAVFIKEKDFVSIAAKAIADGKAVGWFQGSMEFGPRALGNRSILADPRSATMQKDLNMKIKFRESFRPFAPSVLSEHKDKWFDLKCDSPYMMFTAPVKEERRGLIPAVTHTDNSARIQSVSESTNPLYHALLEKFFELTGCPVILNTSFNIRGEPIVCTPEDAFRCFMGCDLDILFIGPFILEKSLQKIETSHDYKNSFAAD